MTQLARAGPRAHTTTHCPTLPQRLGCKGHNQGKSCKKLCLNQQQITSVHAKECGCLCVFLLRAVVTSPLSPLGPLLHVMHCLVTKPLCTPVAPAWQARCPLSSQGCLASRPSSYCPWPWVCCCSWVSIVMSSGLNSFRKITVTSY